MIARSVLFAVLLAAPAESRTQEPPFLIGGVPYQKLETREATLKLMLDRLAPDVGEFGAWRLLGPFAFAPESNDLARALEPEAELARCRVGGAGPDFAKVYRGKRDLELRWETVDVRPNERFDLRRGDANWKNDDCVAYVHTTITSETKRSTEITMGSDDGVRVWLNGRLIHDIDIPRGMDPTSDRVRFDIEPGVNHLLLKVANGAASWEFQLNTRRDLPEDVDALLFDRLDRDFPPSRERAHYALTTIPTPQDTVLEVGGLAVWHDGRPLVATRRGDVYLVNGALDDAPFDATFTLFATGLHEPLGLATRRDADAFAAYTVQRGELTRLIDRDGDDVADEYETVCDDWGVSGNYHEFSFGPEFDRDGRALVTLNVGFCGSLGKSAALYRGCAVMIDEKGAMSWLCDGLRSPNGFAFFTDGTPFYVDNQGDYVATNRLSALLPNSWHGHPASLRWREGLVGDERPMRQPPAVWFPYKKMGQSAADVVLCDENGRFGPFDGQLFVGDQLSAIVMRVMLEKVDGHWQGACFPFLEGLGCGVNRLEFMDDGSLLVGETDRGWTSIGRRRQGLERVLYTGKTPFEILAMRAREDGFELEFTADLDATSATDPASYEMISYTYPYHSDYGAPEVDTKTLRVARVDRLDARKVRLVVEGLRRDYVHELRARGVRDLAGAPLLHDAAYYTLVNVPGRDNRRDDSMLPSTLLVTAHDGEEPGVVKRPQESTFSRVEIQLVEALRGVAKVTLAKDPRALAAESLEATRAIVLFTGGELALSEAERTRLLDWVARGGGLTLLNTAPSTWPSDPRFTELFGARLDSGKDSTYRGDLRFDVVQREHPAVAMLGERVIFGDRVPRGVDFAPTIRPLLAFDAASLPEDSEPPLGPASYWKDHGRGRVFVTMLGRDDDLWRDESFLRHVAVGIEWTMKGPDLPAPRPSDAIALLDGAGAKGFRRDSGRAITVDPETGAHVIGGGDLVSIEEFGDCEVHVEFAVPRRDESLDPNARGNSGVYLQGRYEVQILDSFGSEPSRTSCASIYGVRAADVDAAREPERWQSLDIRFRAPRFDASGAKTESARIDAWWNGRRVHEGVTIDHPTGAARESGERALGSLVLQDHGQAVKVRNVWVRPIR